MDLCMVLELVNLISDWPFTSMFINNILIDWRTAFGQMFDLFTRHTQPYGWLPFFVFDISVCVCVSVNVCISLKSDRYNMTIDNNMSSISENVIATPHFHCRYHP